MTITGTGINVHGQAIDVGNLVPQRFNSTSTPRISVPETTISGVRTIAVISSHDDFVADVNIVSKPVPKSSKKKKT